ncbi:MAG: hypothetical protein HY983_01490 [Candidatus Magasanikbacteria bacterium]|nr:hypothetical protein [Candidatus Magasanikbacteria bacterium]
MKNQPLRGKKRWSIYRNFAIGSVLGATLFGVAVWSVKPAFSYPYPSPTECIDSDGGSNKDELGTTVIQDIDTFVVYESQTDSCYSNTTVREKTCSSPSTIATTLVACGTEKKCVAGACVPNPKSCSDTDGGININQNGTATVQDTLGIVATSTDVCTGAWTVSERYCASSSTIGTLSTTCGDTKVCFGGTGSCVATPYFDQNIDNGGMGYLVTSDPEGGMTATDGSWCTIYVDAGGYMSCKDSSGFRLKEGCTSNNHTRIVQCGNSWQGGNNYTHTRCVESGYNCNQTYPQTTCDSQSRGNFLQTDCYH